MSSLNLPHSCGSSLYIFAVEELPAVFVLLRLRRDLLILDRSLGVRGPCYTLVLLGWDHNIHWPSSRLVYLYRGGVLGSLSCVVVSGCLLSWRCSFVKFDALLVGAGAVCFLSSRVAVVASLISTSKPSLKAFASIPPLLCLPMPPPLVGIPSSIAWKAASSVAQGQSGGHKM